MQGKILIVDQIATNRIMLKVKLLGAFYTVLQAETMKDCLRMARNHQPDMIISALNLPDGTAAQLCEALTAAPPTANIPVLAIGEAPSTELRLETLKAGAQDVACKPVDDVLLLGQVRNLIRAKHAAADWQMRDDTCRALGLAEPQVDFGHAGHSVLICDDLVCAQLWARELRSSLRSRLSVTRPADALRDVTANKLPDTFVLVLPSDAAQAAVVLRLVSSLRANQATRHAGIIALQLKPNGQIAANALDLGVDDLMTNGFEPLELALRIKKLTHRKQLAAQMRSTVRNGLQAAVFDELTGLHNRRYAMPHLTRIADQARTDGQAFAVMLADLDHFKRINDVFGHASGDAVLIEVSKRLKARLRADDLVARIGGEEFLIAMPNTDLTTARAAAQRLCNDISARPFFVPGQTDPIHVTISIGLAFGGGKHKTVTDTAQGLLDEADKGLYTAKVQGRNQVTVSRPAA